MIVRPARIHVPSAWKESGYFPGAALLHFARILLLHMISTLKDLDEFATPPSGAIVMTSSL